MAEKPPLPGWVFIDGTWADPDSDFARRHGYDRKTKTQSFERAQEYLNNSIPRARGPYRRDAQQQAKKEIAELRRKLSLAKRPAPRAARRKSKRAKLTTKLLTTKRCARGSKGSRTIERKRVTVCCPPGKFKPRAKRRKCAVVRRRLVK